mgnify:CR=1 FL=1
MLLWWQVRNVQREVSRDADIVVAAMISIVGSTISKQRGAAPISTATLQCCVAAAQAVQFATPKVGGCWAPGCRLYL